MNIPKPTIVLVQGFFQAPLVYEQLRSDVYNAEYPVVHPELPSICTDIDDSDFLSRTPKDDADAVTTALQHLVEEEERSVVVVMYSYGSIVGSEAIPKHLTQAARRARGHQGVVLRVFYSAAFILPEGRSVLEASGESTIHDAQSDGRSRLNNGAQTVYGDLAAVEAAL